MARPLRITFPGAFYHITSRGNERKAVFKSKPDREKFPGYLKSATLRYDARIHAYCLIDENKGVKSSFLTYYIHSAMKDFNHFQQMG
jgi:hypothetical protein